MNAESICLSAILILLCFCLFIQSYFNRKQEEYLKKLESKSLEGDLNENA